MIDDTGGTLARTAGSKCLCYANYYGTDHCRPAIAHTA